MKTPTLLTVALAASLGAAPTLLALPAAAATAPAYGVTWTVDTAANSVSAYPIGAAGTATALVTIAGGSTGLSAPSAVQVSSTGTIYVANAGNDSITSYAADADGDVAPKATIAGSATGLDAPSSLALAGDQLWTTDPATNVVEAFSAGTSGNELPAETIAGPKTELDHPVAVSVVATPSGLEGLLLAAIGLAGVYVVNAPTAGTSTVTSYASGQFGNQAPVATLGSTLHRLVTPSATLVAGFGEVWVASRTGNSVTEYFVIPGLAAEAERTISGTKTGLDAPVGLSEDAFGDLVVADSGDNSLSVFGPDAHGDAAPVRTVTGIGSDAGTPAADAVYGAVPGRPTTLALVLHRSTVSNGSSATLTWQRPAAVGGGLMGYDVIGEDESGDPLLGLLESSLEEGGVTTTATHLTVHHLKLGHRYVFAVVAVNGFGDSGASNTVEASLAVPASAPEGIGATSSAHSVVVHWESPRNDGGDSIRSYRVEYSAHCVPGKKGCAFHSRTASAHVRFLAVSGLKAGTTYHVRVAALTKLGLGKLSRTVTVTTAA